jgi:hypothetical protein
LFIVLTQTSGAQGTMLTFGKKFCQEFPDPMRQNVATKVW